MRITVPKKIKEDLELIESVYVEMDDTTQPGSDTVKVGVSKLHFAQMEFVNIFDHQWENCSFLQYRLKYLDGSEKVLDFDNKECAKYVSALEEATRACLRTNTHSIYEDSVAGRKDCLKAVEVLMSDVRQKENTSTSDKTLIYYTVYFNKGYVELFDLSVRSLLKNSSKSFDILVITDTETKGRITKTEAAKLKDLKYFVTNSPVDGVNASKKKVDIFEYPEIANYSKVIFLDCDIVAQRSIDPLLELEIKKEVLYTARNKNLGYHHFKTVHHGFRCVSDEFIEEMKMGEQMPFNAGQFMFKVSSAMLAHFKNVRWFMDNWPSEYFFEQCFMCYYFCRGYLTEPFTLRKYIGINSTTHKDVVDDDIFGKALVHFIAPPLDAATKLKYIEEYLAAQEKESTKPGVITKFKGWFKKK